MISIPSWKQNLRTTSQKSSRWPRICESRRGRSWERRGARSLGQLRPPPAPRALLRGRYKSKPSKLVSETPKNRRKLWRKRRFSQSLLTTVICSRHNVAELFKKMFKMSHYKLHFFNALLRKKWRRPHLKHQRIPSNDLASLSTPHHLSGRRSRARQKSQRPWHCEWQAEECRTPEVRDLRMERCQMAMPRRDVSRLRRLQVLWPLYVGDTRWTWTPDYDTWGQSRRHEVLLCTTGGRGGGKYSPRRETSRLAI